VRPIRSAFFPGLCVLLALAWVPPVHASGPVTSPGGVNLTWSRCHAEGVGTQNRAFACDTNDGSEVLVVSFVLDAPLAQASGNEVVISLISQDDPLPLWWDLKNLGACRQTSLSLNLAEDPGDAVCANWQGVGADGGIGAYTGIAPWMSIDPALTNRVRRILIAIAVPADELADLLANTEYFSCNIVIDHAKTVGAGACGGCAGSVCLLLQSLKVTDAISSNDVMLFGGATAGSDMAQWQGSGADCNLVPVRNKTWGQVKALYR